MARPLFTVFWGGEKSSLATRDYYICKVMWWTFNHEYHYIYILATHVSYTIYMHKVKVSCGFNAHTLLKWFHASVFRYFMIFARLIGKSQFTSENYCFLKYILLDIDLLPYLRCHRGCEGNSSSSSLLWNHFIKSPRCTVQDCSL